MGKAAFHTGPFSVSKLDHEPQKIHTHLSVQQEQLQFSRYFSGARQGQPGWWCLMALAHDIAVKNQMYCFSFFPTKRKTLGVNKTKKLCALLDMFN